MQTRISQQYRNTPDGQTADRILRNCVHCGFCTATCPTYQLLGDELDGPRGRIYLIKQLLEGETATGRTRQHLDRCLTCRNCESTCPSGVEYGHLLDIGRSIVNKQTKRNLFDRIQRQLLLWLLPDAKRFSSIIKLGQVFRPVLPAGMKKSIPIKQKDLDWPTQEQKRKVLILEGCVQPSLAPEINHATAHVLNRFKIQSVRVAQTCCGALAHHLTAEDVAHQRVKQNIDLWWPYVEQGIEAIVSNASGCGVMVKDYGYLLQNDAQYSEKAQTISSLCKDICEIIQDESISNTGKATPISYHPPCTLQHGQKINGVVEDILSRAGFKLLEFSDKHLCCGSAGTYSILQKKISTKLLHNKLTNLLSNKPDVIVTANIGCLLQLRSQSPVPVMHWVELLHQELD